MDKKEIIFVCFVIFYILFLGFGIWGVVFITAEQGPNYKFYTKDIPKIRLDTSQGPSQGPSQDPSLAIYDLDWDKAEGGYMINVRLGGNVIPMVFDSGSSILSAKGPQCTWQECDDCDVSNCPCAASIHGGAACVQESYF